MADLKTISFLCPRGIADRFADETKRFHGDGIANFYTSAMLAFLVASDDARRSDVERGRELWRDWRHAHPEPDLSARDRKRLEALVAKGDSLAAAILEKSSGSKLGRLSTPEIIAELQRRGLAVSDSTPDED